MENRKRLFIDMDGTLAEYRTFESMEQYFQNGYFSSLKPLQHVVDAIKEFHKNNPNVEIYILSACPADSNAPAEKDEWLDKYLPEVKKENRIYTIIGQNKRDFIPGGINRNDFLFDDYPHNLHDWCKEGSGIKCFNGLNANSEKWQGSCVSYKNTASHIAKALADIIVRGELVIDKMDEIQIKNEMSGQSMYIDREELSQFVDKYFRGEYKDVDDFRRNYTPSDWDFIKRLSPNARIEVHTSVEQYKFEFDTISKKIANNLSVIRESLNNQRKEIVENEMSIRMLAEQTRHSNDATVIAENKKTMAGIASSMNEQLNVWNDYFAKTMQDLDKATTKFFARYKAASERTDFSKVSLDDDKKKLLAEMEVAEKVCSAIFKEEKANVKGLRQMIDEITQPERNNKSVSDELFEDEKLSVPTRNTKIEDNILDL